LAVANKYPEQGLPHPGFVRATSDAMGGWCHGKKWMGISAHQFFSRSAERI
jgi:hypothetical protein